MAPVACSSSEVLSDFWYERKLYLSPLGLFQSGLRGWTRVSLLLPYVGHRIGLSLSKGMVAWLSLSSASGCCGLTLPGRHASLGELVGAVVMQMYCVVDSHHQLVDADAICLALA